MKALYISPNKQEFLKKLPTCLPKKEEQKPWLSQKAEEYYKQGKYEIAFVFFQKAQELSTKDIKEKNVFLERMADCRYQQGLNYEKTNAIDAWLLFNKAEKIYKDCLGEEHKKTIETSEKAKHYEQISDKELMESCFNPINK